MARCAAGIPCCPQRNPTPDQVPSFLAVPRLNTPNIARVHPHAVASSRRGGFALLITITLLAFLVLLLVSLASLTRVETQVAANNTQLAQARANALFALNLAIGQLQRHAGPDRRVTARADITDDPDDSTDNVANPLWTGVWDALPTDIDPDDGVPAATTHANSDADTGKPLAWLVSGNENDGTALTPTAAVAVPAVGNDNVWLLRKVAGHDLSNTEDYPTDLSVRLANSAITVPVAQVPGLDASGPAVRVGSYAWWVGDEGVKAKVNMNDPYRSAAAGGTEAAWRIEAGPRPDLGLLSHDEFSAVFTGTTAAFEASRAKVLSYEQVALLDAALVSGEGNKQTAGYYHDLTVVGQGVLADTLRGGLRRDLTRGLAATPSAGSVAETEIGDAVDVFTPPMPGPYGRTALTGTWTRVAADVGTAKTGEANAPTWSQVRSWAGARVPSGHDEMAPVRAPLATVTRNGITAPTTAEHAIMPVVVMLELGYGLDVDDDARRYRIMLSPVVVLMNPYNVGLAEETYSVTYTSTVTSDSHLRFSMTQGTSTDPTTDRYLTYGTTPLVTGNSGRLTFNITDSFGPGEIRVYSMPASGDFPANTGILTLASGISTNRAYLETGMGVPTWYDPSLRTTTDIQWSKVPADHPQISLALGASTTTAPASSTAIRYIQTASSYLFGTNASPKNVTMKLGVGENGAARRMRTMRYVLRHAEMGMLARPNSNMTVQGETGTVPADATSGARFLIESNPRAIVSQRLGGRDGVAHYAVQLLNGTGYSLDYDDVGNGVTHGFWGGSIEDDGYGSSRISLFDVPRENEKIVSLGRLGHVNWGVDGKHPAYPLGNSFASAFYPAASPDYGYALNEALWDRFFLSTLPASLSVRPANLPNSRLRFHDPDGVASALDALEGETGYELAATRLMIDGAFNINSTSVDAWAAFLGSVQEADYEFGTSSGSRTDSGVRPFPRVRNFHAPDPTAAGLGGNLYEWTGYRRLDGDQLKALATEIVAGIRARGRPARSLAEFMNRDLAKLPTDIHNQMGVVQAAIDKVVNTATPDASGNGTGLSALSGLNKTRIVPTTFGIADNPDAVRGKMRSTGAPGFLMQNDLLTPLAPSMAARSDTFRVRAYGETRNPVTGDITGRAWCEAIVQRMPEFAGGEAAELRLDDAALGAVSKTFGRKFRVTQFRWLSSDEI